MRRALQSTEVFGAMSSEVPINSSWLLHQTVEFEISNFLSAASYLTGVAEEARI